MVDSADNGEITEQLAARKLPYTTDVRGRAGRRQSSPDSPGPGVAPRPAQVLEAESQLLWAVVAASATRSGAFPAMSIRVAKTATGSPGIARVVPRTHTSYYLPTARARAAGEASPTTERFRATTCTPVYWMRSSHEDAAPRLILHYALLQPMAGVQGKAHVSN
jgi:hypothetical protein